MHRLQSLQDHRRIGSYIAACFAAGAISVLIGGIHPKGETLAALRLSACVVILLWLGIPTGAGYLWARRHGTVSTGAGAGTVAGSALAMGLVVSGVVVFANTPGSATYRGGLGALIVGIPLAVVVLGVAFGALGAGLGALGGMVGTLMTRARGDAETQ